MRCFCVAVFTHYFNLYCPETLMVGVELKVMLNVSPGCSVIVDVVGESACPLTSMAVTVPPEILRTLGDSQFV